MPYVSPRADQVQTIQHQDIARRPEHRDSPLFSIHQYREFNVRPPGCLSVSISSISWSTVTMRFILIFLTLVLGFCDAARRTTTAASTAATYAGRQLVQRGQRQENTWDLVELQKLDNQATEFWNRNPTAPANDTELEDSGVLNARQSYPGLPSPGDTNELPGPISSTSTTRPTIRPPPGCYGLRGQFPSPKSCANYLNCWDGVVIEQTCPDGLLFNAQKLVCDYDYNVSCGDRPLPPPKPSMPPGSKLCPEPNGRYRSSTNCSEFYVCVFRKPIKFSCPRGLVYNDILDVCDYPYNVDCKGAATPRPPPITISPITKPQTPAPTYAPPYGPSQPPSEPPQQPSYGIQQPPTSPPQQQPSYGQTYPANPWLEKTDPWHQRPVASQAELEKLESDAQFSELSQAPELIENPWNLLQTIPASLAKVPCENGNIHRLNDACVNVVVCRNSRPQLVQCSLGLTYDRPSDSCKPFSIAKC